MGDGVWLAIFIGWTSIVFALGVVFGWLIRGLQPPMRPLHSPYEERPFGDWRPWRRRR